MPAVLGHIQPAAKPVTGDLSAVAVLLSTWKSNIQHLEGLDKASGALPVWRERVKELEEALVQAEGTPAWLTVSQAHTALGIPSSTVRYYCKAHAPEIGAEKFRGMWRINARSLETFLAQPHVRAAAKAA